MYTVAHTRVHIYVYSRKVPKNETFTYIAILHHLSRHMYTHRQAHAQGKLLIPDWVMVMLPKRLCTFSLSTNAHRHIDGVGI